MGRRIRLRRRAPRPDLRPSAADLVGPRQRRGRLKVERLFDGRADGHCPQAILALAAEWRFCRSAHALANQSYAIRIGLAVTDVEAETVAVLEQDCTGCLCARRELLTIALAATDPWVERMDIKPLDSRPPGTRGYELVITTQVREPAEEATAQAFHGSLSSTANPRSGVRCTSKAKYPDNPEPRWTGRPGLRRDPQCPWPIGVRTQSLGRPGALFDLRIPVTPGRSCQTLIAGCGTVRETVGLSSSGLARIGRVECRAIASLAE